jgi:hypothetical protein
MDIATVRQFVSPFALADDIKVQKAIDFVKENAVVENTEEAAE